MHEPLVLDIAEFICSAVFMFSSTVSFGLSGGVAKLNNITILSSYKYIYLIKVFITSFRIFISLISSNTCFRKKCSISSFERSE